MDIIDNGAGIEEENLEIIFDKFVSFTSKYNVIGTGIGLFLSREIITAHGGKITASSEGRDMGAKFTISLPTIK